MSNVINIIILFSSSEDEDKIIHELSQFEYKKDFFFNVKSIKDKNLPKNWHGGSKGFEASVLIGAYNYLSISDLINYMINIKWEYIEDVQLLYKEEGDFVFKLANLKEPE
ncbi:hypothetical protein SAMN05444671_3764 [Flavobacterium sp. CF108]|uniref:hypothetical protein n=1 Tax=unclassified Flavobacterium TaxID=196869 RepID=UPI0008D3295B|nr:MULTISPECIES: hypothetical protein [unclassified Flavobacterium]SEO55564.1 hypothetical protein SAMN04487978_3197 [Flavobacterium sp. fv08]SHH76118.1 hypothetical protein SAMN05444671_3764 [Flavobacterium sp. CF108]